MAEIALDAVCSRKEQSSNSSYHKGLNNCVPSPGACVASDLDVPLHFSR
jgi:hypothetical protein